MKHRTVQGYRQKSKWSGKPGSQEHVMDDSVAKLALSIALLDIRLLS